MDREAEWLTFFFPRERNALYRDRLTQLARLRAGFERQPLHEVTAELPAELPEAHRWVPTRTERLWMRDVDRYRLWMLYGLSRRQVAFWEDAREQGEAVTLNPPTVSGKPIPRKIRGTPRGWRAVGLSIQQVYEAVYLEPFSKAKARRATSPTTLPEYDCPMHANNDCRLGNAEGRRQCAYLRWWNAEADAIPGVPGEDTGKLRATWGGRTVDGPEAATHATTFEEDTLDVERAAAWLLRTWSAEDRRALASRLLAPEAKE